MLKTVIIYNVNTGQLDGGYFSFEDSLPADGSTGPEAIEGILAKSVERRALILDGRVKFDPESQGILDGRIVAMEPPPKEVKPTVEERLTVVEVALAKLKEIKV